MERIMKIEIYDDGSVTVEQKPTRPHSKNVPNVSIYARFFNSANPNWSKNSVYNLMFLKIQQDYANDILRTRGFLFLNDVLDLLGIPRTEVGAVVGWTYRKDNTIGDNFVDFGIDADRNQDFVNGHDNTPLLDFNVDGCILDKI